MERDMYLGFAICKLAAEALDVADQPGRELMGTF